MNTNNIKVNTQSSIKIILDKTLYFDPYKIDNEIHDADYIFITHEHYDHFDIKSINNVKNDNTIIFAPKSMEDSINKLNFKDYIYLNPNEEININDYIIRTIPAYNIEKQYHPKSNNWLGYIITYKNITYYIAGDTDKTKESENIKCDIAFIPIGGTYTMDVLEALKLIKIIKPKIVIPIHYGSIVGNKEDGQILKNNLSDTNIEVIEKLY